MQTLQKLSMALQQGEMTSRELVEKCLAAAEASTGQGAKVFTQIYRESALADADQADMLIKMGNASSAFAGIPISTKDLFDVAGSVTRAGSVVLSDAAPAASDAEIVTRLKSAGFIIVGRTNMTEFAYSGLGLNPHYGTPLSVFERSKGRAPGGSSSGAAVSVTDNMAAVGIGTDTGGSCRIPAAFNALVGYKPTARRVPLDGTYPLSHSLDSIGPIGRSVSCCQIIDAILAKSGAFGLDRPDLNDLRIAVLGNFVTDGMDQFVAGDFERVTSQLSAAGVTLFDLQVPFLDQLPELNARGGIGGAEAYAQHKELLASCEAGYDPRVNVRLKKALEQSETEYEELLEVRAKLIEEADMMTAEFDAVIMPTVPIIPPLLSELTEDDDYGRINLLALRNPSIGNLLDRCAISIPMNGEGMPPTGLMIMGETMGDDKLFSIAAAIEEII